MIIDIKQYEKADVLRVLYNGAQTQGMGILHFVKGDMDPSEAKTIIDETPHLYFDYLRGRVMKVDLSSTEFNAGLYDRDNGEGSAQKQIALLD